jgi:hypothetical protein
VVVSQTSGSLTRASYAASGGECDPKRFNGGPWGLGTWLAFAREHGKQLGIAEWGVWDQGQGHVVADDPVYIDNMYRSFRANAADIAYETYFNAMPDAHALCNWNGAPTSFPRAAATYKADWSQAAWR